jgi:hypothetical protein
LIGTVEDLNSPQCPPQCPRLEAARWLRFPDLGSPVSLNLVCEVLGIPSRRLARAALRRAGLG